MPNPETVKLVYDFSSALSYGRIFRETIIEQMRLNLMVYGLQISSRLLLNAILKF